MDIVNVRNASEARKKRSARMSVFFLIRMSGNCLAKAGFRQSNRTKSKREAPSASLLRFVLFDCRNPAFARQFPLILIRKNTLMRALRFFLASLAFLTFTISISAQQKNAPQQKPCSSGDYRLLDFWVGDWSLSWPASPGGTPAGTGTNKVVRTLDNCVIQELFEADKPIGLHGMSVSTFDAPSGKWKQTWVDNSR